MEAEIPPTLHRAIAHVDIRDVTMDICCDNSKYRTVLISSHMRYSPRQNSSAGDDRNPGSRRGLCHVRQEQWLQTMSRRAISLGVCSICNKGSWQRMIRFVCVLVFVPLRHRDFIQCSVPSTVVSITPRYLGEERCRSKSSSSDEEDLWTYHALLGKFKTDTVATLHIKRYRAIARRRSSSTSRRNPPGAFVVSVLLERGAP